jgi:hypothetical protein
MRSRVFVRRADALNVIESSVVYPDAQLSQMGMVH